jgi:hypothetical protein
MAIPTAFTLDSSRLSRMSSSARAAACLACFFELPDPEAVLPAAVTFHQRSVQVVKIWRGFQNLTKKT